MSQSKAFNPLDKTNLGISVAKALLQQKPVAVEHIELFSGAGVYALYYTGSFKAYEAISKRCRGGKFEMPIYVGKAIPAGGRKGAGGFNASLGKSLYNRLQEHAESIRAVENLNIRDFFCRFLVVDDIWIPLGESLLIARFAPVWNNIVDGFGNHDPGKGRYEGMRPRWDVIHPGRSWATKCKPRLETSQQITADITTYFRSAVIPGTSPLYFANEESGDYSVSNAND